MSSTFNWVINAQQLNWVFVIIAVISVSGNIVQVKWVKRPDLHGYTFTKSESFTSEMDSTADCARFCSKVPLCVSFTFGNKVCKGHNEKMHNLDSSITSAGMQYYEVSNGKLSSSALRFRQRKGERYKWDIHLQHLHFLHPVVFNADIIVS